MTSIFLFSIFSGASKPESSVSVFKEVAIMQEEIEMYN